MPVAEVRQHRGSPALFLDGEPVYASVFWCPPPTDEGWPHAEHAASMAQAGVHIYTFGFTWPEPSPDGTYDLDPLTRAFEQVLAVDPDALFLPRFQLEAPDWWIAAHPDELETFADGTTDAQSYASAQWRQDAGAYLRQVIAVTRSLPFGDRFIGYHVCAGWTAEWLKNGARDNRSSDFNPAMIRAFRAWLERHYHGDESALRAAWHDPNVTFATAMVPGPSLQERADFYCFRDPAATRQDIDYFACLCDVVVDNIAYFCSLVKEATARQALAGVFYGYAMELWWSNGWFGRHPNQTHTSYQRIGHLALHRVLELDDVDFLASPYSYGMRGIGGTNGFMVPSESARLHGKLYFSEDDTRTHLATTHGISRFGSPGSPLTVDQEVAKIDGYDLRQAVRVRQVLGKVAMYEFAPPHRDTDYGALNTREETEAVLKRNFANVLTRHVGIWWGYPSPLTSGTLADPRLEQIIGRMVELGRWSMTLDRAPAAEIAVIVDESSWFYLSPRNELAIPLIQRQYLWHLPRIGAPYDLYLASDLAAGRVRDYKCYIFLNQYFADAETREGIKRAISGDGKVAVWIHGAGFVQDDLSAENCADLTGIRLECHHTEWGPNVIVTNFDHPITRDLPAYTTIGTDSRIGPLFTCNDDQAIPLGALHFTRGRWRTGFAVKEFDDRRSVWIGAPSVPPNVLRGIARYAGVHIYSEAEDVLYVDRQFIGIYALKPGERRIALPQPSDVVEAFTGRLVAEATTDFTDLVSPHETRLYYIGPKENFPMPVRQ